MLSLAYGCAHAVVARVRATETGELSPCAAACLVRAPPFSMRYTQTNSGSFGVTVTDEAVHRR